MIANCPSTTLTRRPRACRASATSEAAKRERSSAAHDVEKLVALETELERVHQLADGGSPRRRRPRDSSTPVGRGGALEWRHREVRRIDLRPLRHDEIDHRRGAIARLHEVDLVASRQRWPRTRSSPRCRCCRMSWRPSPPWSVMMTVTSPSGTCVSPDRRPRPRESPVPSATSELLRLLRRLSAVPKPWKRSSTSSCWACAALGSMERRHLRPGRSAAAQQYVRTGFTKECGFATKRSDVVGDGHGVGVSAPDGLLHARQEALDTRFALHRQGVAQHAAPPSRSPSPTPGAARAQRAPCTRTSSSFSARSSRSSAFCCTCTLRCGSSWRVRAEPRRACHRDARSFRAPRPRACPAPCARASLAFTVRSLSSSSLAKALRTACRSWPDHVARPGEYAPERTSRSAAR